MKEEQVNFWNERFGASEYVYGTAPNQFFKAQLELLKPGDILLPAEGEGRNALYAMKQGWNVSAFDSSSSGKKKALKLSLDHGENLHYHVCDVLEFNTDKQFDVLGLVYAHFPKEIRKEAHHHLLKFIKPNGRVIFEAFAKEQLGNTSGGPKNLEMLFSIEEIKEEFPQLKFEMLEQQTIQLEEGEHHKGIGEVIRFVGIKS